MNPLRKLSTWLAPGSSLTRVVRVHLYGYTGEVVAPGYEPVTTLLVFDPTQNVWTNDDEVSMGTAEGDWPMVVGFFVRDLANDRVASGRMDRAKVVNAGDRLAFAPRALRVGDGVFR